MRKRICPDRRGATAVEFAFTLPVLFLVVFGLIELSRLVEIDGAADTALLVGVRQASIKASTPNDVEASVEEFLEALGIRSFELEIRPKIFTPTTSKIFLTLDIPLNTTNGFVFQNFVRGRKISKSLDAER